MSKQGKSRKPLIIGVIAAVAILAVVLALLLTQCGGGEDATQSTPVQTTGAAEVPTYELYWNVDRAEYDGKSEAGMSSRQQESDGYFHIRFFMEGEMVELRAADRKVVNAIDINDLMGLEFDENGIIIGVQSIDDMPLEQVGWQFYVQSVGGKLLKLNSSKSYNGLEVLLDITDKTGIWDMTGMEGEVGKAITPISGDRVIAIANLAGELTHVYVYDRPEYMKTFEAECQHCKKTVEWKMWTKTNELPKETGHYQLQNNISGMSAQQAIVEDGKVCLDLNGMVVDGKDNARVYTLHNSGAQLAIMDTSEGQKGVLRGHSTASDQGGVVWVRYGACYLYAGTLDASDMTSKLNGTAVEVPKDSYFYMYGGTIIGGTAKWQRNDKGAYVNGLGGAVSVRGKFVMHDGVIRDGTALGVVTARNADGSPKTYQRGIGGNIYVQSGGVFEMHGGTIKNGTATHSGGNVYVDGTSEFLMDGGVISGGKVTGKGRNGGNVYITSKSTFDFNGGSILNGVAYNCAGNLYLNGTVTMRGGHIGGGKIYDWDTKKLTPTANTANVFNVNGKFIMYGGSVDGSFTATDTVKGSVETLVLLSGYATIMGPENDQCDDLVLTVGGDNVTVRVGKLYDRAKIGVNTSTGIFTLPAAEHNVDNFFSNISDAEIQYVDGCIALGRFSCICGNNDKGDHFGKCDGTKLFWGPMVSTTMPTTTGNYYLPRVLNENGELVPRTINAKSQASMVEDAQIAVDLNGGTIVAPKNLRGFSLHNPGTKLTITDSSEGKTGVVKSAGEGTTQGNVVWVRYGQFDLYGGTLDGSEYQLYKNWEAGTDGIFGTTDDKESDRKGGTVCLAAGTTFNMYGGTVIGNQLKGAEITKTNSETVTVDGKEEVVKTDVKRTVAANGGGSVYVPGKAVFNMYSGEIRDGYSVDRGGNLLIDSTGTANLYGGVIADGETAGWGGNIYISDTATVNIAGGTVSGGVSPKNGGSIYVGSSTTLRMTSGLIENGKTTGDQGGNIFCTGKMELLGGTVTGGRTEAKKNGGNIAINSPKDILIAGATITDGYSGATGGNIGISTTSTAGSLTIGEGTVISGGYAVTNGGNLFISPNNANKNDPNATVTMTGGTITGGTAAGEGGNVYVGASGAGQSIFTMTDGTVTGGTAKTGGNIRVAAGAEVVIDGENAIIEKGVTNNSGHGGNVNVSGTFTLNAGTIRDGNSINTAGNIYASGSGKVVVNGGKILGGIDKNGANAADSSIYIVSAALELRGGEMDGGVHITNYNNNNGSLKISGNPVVKSGTRPGLTINWGNGTGGTASHIPYAEIDEPMTEGAEVYINCSKWEVGKFTTATEESYAKYFEPNDATRSIGYVDGCIALGKVYCICGAPNGEHYGNCDGKQLFWLPWASTTTLPNTSGNYYIHPSVDVTLSAQWKPNAGTVVNLDLNGRSITCGGRVIALSSGNVTLSITDNSANRNGKIYKTGSYSGQGGLLWITGGSKVDLYAGIVDGTGFVNGYNGGAVCVEGASSFNMYGGTIKGTASQSNGGNVAVKGTSVMTMTGGTITGGGAYSYGGNFYITDTAKVYLSGGKVEGGKAGKDVGGTANGWGGNIEVTSKGELYVSGDVLITGGSCYGNGGNIRIGSATAKMEMSGGTVEKGTTNDNGGNIFVNGALTVTGGTIKDGTAKNGGNISINTGDTVSISNVTISGGQSTSGQGGNVRVFNNAAATLNLNNVTLTGGKTSASKMTTANLDVTVGATVNITDTKIDGYASIVSPDAKITLSGKVEITGAETNLTLGGAMLNLVDFSEESMIGVNYALGGVFTTTTEEKFKANFTSDDPSLFVDFVDGKMVLALGRYSCLCGKSAEPHDPGCDGVTHFWLPWNASDSVPTETGYWYLTKDVSLSTQTKITTSQNIVLDLNGKTVQNAENAAIRIYWISAVDTHITITDTVGGGKMVNNSTYDQGMLFWVYPNADANSGFTIIKGTFDASGATYKLNGTAPSNNGGGSAVYLSNNKNYFTMYGGELLGGKTPYGGSAIFGQNWGSIITIHGGTVTGNAEDTYPAIRAMGNLVITGGSITGGVETNMERGTAKLTISGSPVIDELVITRTTDSQGVSTNAATEGKLTVININGTLGNATKIKLSVQNDQEFVFSNKTDKANADNFIAKNAGQSIIWIEDEALPDYGKLYIGATKCLCGATDGNHVSYTDPDGNTVGCDGSAKPWMPWTSTQSLPTTSGYWYLTDNVAYTRQSSIAKDQNVILDLNGKTVQAAKNDGTDINARVYSIHNPGITLTITDTVGGGKMIASTERSDTGTVVWVRRDSTWNADDNIGTFILMGGELVGNNPNNTGNGGVVSVSSYGTFYMLGGKINGGTTSGWGGNVMVDDYAAMYLVNGEITGGQSGKGGGNLLIDSNATFFMTGGTISNGKANACNGGNIYLGSGTASATITGGTISGGIALRPDSAGAEGGNIKQTGGTLTLSGVQILNGRAGALAADGVTVEYGTSSAMKGWGGNIHSAAGTLNIGEGTVISGGISGGNGGNVNVSGTVNITGGEIKDGESKLDRGGNLWMGGSAKVTIEDAVISGGIAGGDRGGNIHANANAVFTITGGTVTGGKVKSSGSDISANINLEGGTGKVTIGGTAKVNGYFYIRNASTVIEISGKPVISGGSTNLTPVNVITVGTLQSGAKIGINREPGVFTTNTVDASYAEFFTSDKADTAVAYATDGVDKGKLAIGKVYAACGLTEAHDAHDYCDGQLHTWTVWSSENNAAPSTNGYWYLSEKLVITSAKTITNAADIALDLKGNILEVDVSASGRAYSTYDSGTNKISVLFTNTSTANSSIVIDDTAGTGKTGGDQGRVFWGKGSDKHVAVYNVDFDITKAVVQTNNGSPKDLQGVVFSFETGAGNTSTMSLYDVEITGGEATASVLHAGTNASILLHNTTIKNHHNTSTTQKFSGVYLATATSKLTLSGQTSISGCTTANGNAANITMNAGTLELADSYVGSTTAPQGIDAPVDTVILAEVGGEWFTADSVDKKVVYMEDGMKLVAADAKIYCVCGSTTAVHALGCDGTDYQWKALTRIKDLETPGNYYLTADTSATEQVDATEGALRLDLNGWTITDTDNRFLTTNGSTNAKITVTDTNAEKDGAIVVDHTNRSGIYGGQGVGFWITGSGAELNWIRGKLDVSKATTNKYGGVAIYANSGVTVNMYDGTIFGGTCTRDSSTGNNPAYGGSVRILAGGTMNMYGGTITGGKSVGTSGGNVHVAGTFIMHNGTISNGTTSQADVGGTIYEGYAGNICIDGGNAEFKMLGGTVSGGNSNNKYNNSEGKEVGTNHGGNIYLHNGVFNMDGGLVTGGMIKGGTANMSSNVSIYAGMTMNMTGGQINGCVTGTGTGVKTLNFSGSAKILTPTAANPVASNNVSLAVTVNIGKVNEDARIGFQLSAPSGTSTEVADILNGNRFLANINDPDSYDVSMSGLSVYLSGDKYTRTYELFVQNDKLYARQASATLKTK